MSGFFERSLDGRGVTDFGVDYEIGDIVIKPRRVGCERGFCVGYRPQYVVLDDNAFGSVFGRSKGLGDNESDGGAHMANAVGEQDVMGRRRYRRAVAVVKDDVRRHSRRSGMGNGVEPVGVSILAGQHRNHAGHSPRRHGVDAAD